MIQQLQNDPHAQYIISLSFFIKHLMHSLSQVDVANQTVNAVNGQYLVGWTEEGKKEKKCFED